MAQFDEFLISRTIFKEKYMQMNPYLYFDGDCEAAFKFYESVLGAKIGEQALMASDAPPGRFEKQAGFSLSLGFTDAAEAERVYHALAENGTKTMPIAETFWAVRFGMLVDRFGIPWMVNCEKAVQKAA
jgi:PhnB protein